MKRSSLKRKTPLARGDSELKRTEFKAKPPKTPPKPRKPLARAAAPKPKVRAGDGRRQAAPVPVGPLSPGAWREEVWRRCGGRCVMTGIAVPLDANLWCWQAHHCVPKHVLPPERKYDPRNGVVLLTRAHSRHETATERVPAERLPASVFIFAEEVGGSALARLAVQHPRSSPAAGKRGNENEET